MTYREQLVEVAYGQHGLVTTRDAHQLGIPVVELGKLAARGKLDRIAYGLYRVPEIPPGPHDQYAEATLRVGPEAFLMGDSVLAFHGLGLVNPRAIKVGSRRRNRPKLPRTIKLIHRTDIPEEAITLYEGIRSTTVAQAIIDSIGTVMSERLLLALRAAGAEGLVNRSERSIAMRAVRAA